jgi:alkylhydroperoxidase family enzyme
MAFIDYIPYDQAPEELQSLYRKYGGKDRRPANIVRVAGPRPKVMEAHLSFFRAIMYGESSLSRQQQEMIAVLVSGINQCHY